MSRKSITPKALTMDDIMVTIIEVEIPGRDASVWLRQPSADDALYYFDTASVKSKDGDGGIDGKDSDDDGEGTVDHRRMVMDMMSRLLCNKDGSRLIPEGQEDKIHHLSIDVFGPVMHKLTGLLSALNLSIEGEG